MPPGNHEWMAPRRSFTVQAEIKSARRHAAKHGVHFLMDEAVVIDGVRFLGATLWTDWAISGNVGAAMGFAAMAMPDHSEIFVDESGSLLSPRQTLEWHRVSRIWLEAELQKTGDWEKTVVVTHHLPHPRSVALRYKDSPLSPAFVSDLSELVENCGAALWVHGLILMIVLIIMRALRVLYVTLRDMVQRLWVRQLKTRHLTRYALSKFKFHNQNNKLV